MSVSHYRRLLFCFTVLGLIAVVALLYYYWPMLLFKAQEWQKLLHQQLTRLLVAIKKDETQAGYMLIGLSFLYGVLHSAGPGHGKMVISTYLVTQPIYYKQTLVITLLSTLLQGVVAIVLVMLAINVLSLTRQELSLGERWLEYLSYGLIMILGVFLCLKVLYKQFKQIYMIKVASQRPVINCIDKPITMSKIPFQQQHEQCSAVCGCGHKHMPSANELKQANSLLSRLAIILAIGIRPCSGAILVMVFAKMLDIFSWGILAVLAMSLGTALTVSIIALLVIFFRRIALKFIQHRLISAQSLSYFSFIITLIGGGLLIVFGLLFLLSAPAVNPMLFGLS